MPIFNRFKLGAILGYLAAGVLIGPYALDLLHQEEGVFHVAEFGIVLFLFIIGLELSLSRLWSLRRTIFGLGAAQMIATSLALAALFIASGALPVPAAAIAGLSLAFSSTVFAAQLMKDRGELTSAYGAQAFSVLLLQDLAVIPLLAAIPFVAGAVGEAAGMTGWLNALKAAGVIAALVVIGRYALDPVLRLVAHSGSREAFAATALFIVAATALAVSWAGLSMALGAFLAGVLLAESSYRYQIETDIEPDVIVRETLESSLLLSREALTLFGHSERTIEDFIQQFRKLDRERLLAQIDYGPDAAKDLLYRKFETKGAGE